MTQLKLIIAKENEGKPFLGRVLKTTQEGYEGLKEKNLHMDGLQQEFSIAKKNVIAILNTKALIEGNCFGLNPKEVFRKKTNHDFGDLCWFYTPSSEKKEIILSAFDKAWRLLKKNRLEYPVDETVWEIRPSKKVKHSGMYKSKGKIEPAIFEVRPELMEKERDMTYVVLHEVGHHLHDVYFTHDKGNAAWIKLFEKTVMARPVSKEELSRIKNELLNGEVLPSKLIKSVAEEDQPAIRTILRHIRTNNNLSPRELDLLFVHEQALFSSIWPDKGITEKDLKPIISEYATKNYKELFAEAFSFWLTGRITESGEFPSAVEKLLEKSLSVVRDNLK